MMHLRVARQRLIAWCGSLAVGALLSGQTSAQVVLDGSLGPAGPVSGPIYVIGPEVGQLRGTNLFHSFSQLNVAQGEVVGFIGPVEVTNVLARVTGGSASTIDGRLVNAIPGANLFLINPSGIVFGPNASVEVTGSFVATTADVIRFADGTGRFHASLAEESVLTTAAPSAFGFLPESGGAGKVQIIDSAFNSADRTALTLVAGEVSISGGFINAPGGRVNVVAAKSGTLTLDATDISAVIDATGLSERGPATLENSFVVVDGDDAGGTGAGGRIDIVAADANVRSGTLLSSTTLSAAEGMGIRFDVTGLLSIDGGSSISTASQGTGRSGDIVVSAGSVRVFSEFGLGQTTSITTFSFGPGSSGDVRVNATDVHVRAAQPDGAVISTAAGGIIPGSPAGSGAGGKVELNVGRLRVEGTGAALRTSALNDQGATGGDITVAADNVEVVGGAQILGQSDQNARSGLIDITTRQTLLVSDAIDVDIPGIGTVPFESSISTTTFTSTVSPQGIQVRGGRVLITNGASIDTQTALADAGPIEIDVDSLELTAGGRIFADSSGVGDAAPIRIHARSVQLDSELSRISSSTSGTGDGGSISIDASERVSLRGGSTVLTVATDSGGQGGAIAITAPDVEAFDTSVFSAGTIDGGNGGELSIVADRILFSGDRSGISSPTIVTGPGKVGGIGGRVTLTASESVVLDSGARISTIAGTREAGEPPADTDTTALTGAAGDTMITAPLVRITGRTNPDDKNSPPSRITSATNLKTSGAGRGGSIAIAADRVEVADGGLLTANSTGSGAAGSVSIVSGDITIDGGSVSSSSSFVGNPAAGLTAGMGGSVSMNASRSVILRNNANVSVESVASNAGNISIDAIDRIRVTDSTIITSAGGTGGDINLGSRDSASGHIDPFVIVFDTARINANAVVGNAGNIFIISQEYVTSSDSLVTATSEQSAPGRVDVSAAYTELAGGLVRLPGSFTNAAATLEELCGMQMGGTTSSFITTGRGGAPISPEGLAPSFDLGKTR